ncbi:MAG: hypothetical protein WDZ83_19070 [Rhizobiaceae bacterium]
MNLLLGRAQKDAVFSLVPLRLGSGVMFQLHAELELNEEEKRLLATYKFTRASLVLSDPIDDLKKAFRPALLLGIPAYIVFWFIFGFWTAPSVTLVFIGVMTVVYFRALRERILVSDLLDGGRTFHCDSIIDLIHKEAFLENICAYLRQVLESAKNWQDREIIPIAPLDKKVAKLVVLRGARA